MGTENSVLEKKIKTYQEIVQKTKEQAEKLNKYFKNQEVVVLIILKGGIAYSAELLKYLTFDTKLEFVNIKSYLYNRKSIEPKVNLNLLLMDRKEIKDNVNLLIIDDLIDTGETIQKLIGLLQKKFNFENIVISTLFSTKNAKLFNYPIYSCWKKTSNEFLFGFGLDIDEKYRNLPYIAVYKGNKES